MEIFKGQFETKHSMKGIEMDMKPRDQIVYQKRPIPVELQEAVNSELKKWAC